MLKPKSGKKSFLIEFFGKECPYCVKMQPLIQRLEKETGLKIKQFEVWYNQDNHKKFNEYAHIFIDACGGQLGVPAFYNSKTGEALCGAVDYEILKEWAIKKNTPPSYVS
ncbi:MAG: conjugal transfer protein TraF [Candidatus Diapherotrites archaeon]|nr:conjugal transfer protein TraF [Candidatus Diapherotrites archaeon]